MGWWLLRRCARTRRLRRGFWACAAVTLALCTIYAALGSDPGVDSGDASSSGRTQATPPFTVACDADPTRLDQPVAVGDEPTAQSPRVPGRLPPGDLLRFSWSSLPDEPGGPERYRLFESGIPYSVSRSRARRCLRGRHLVLVGDSVMRATYMNLVHFLHVGHWYSEGAAHFEEIRMWPNSDEYYANTTRAFRAADGTAYELCDCHRTSRGGHTENRYYRDVRRGISVSYVANLQHVIAGRDPLSLSPAGCIQPAHLTGARCCNAQQARCQPGRCEKETLDWKDQFSAPSASLNGTLALFGGPGSIDSIVFNVGLWGCLDKTYGASYAAAAERLVGAGRYLQSVGGVRQLIWRATTAKQSRPWEERCDTEAHVLIPRLYEAGWRILDAFNATVLLKPPALDCFYDANHIHRSRHRGLSEMLLTDLFNECP